MLYPLWRTETLEYPRSKKAFIEKYLKILIDKMDATVLKGIKKTSQ